MTSELKEAATAREVFRKLLELAREHKRHVVMVIILSFLSTAADLANPLIYREAINDVAGLFVQQVVQPVGAGVAIQAHRAGDIAPRTPEQTLRTLILAVVLLFCTSVVGYFFSLRSDYYGAFIASRIESKLIVGTFSHVLRLPLSFFSHRASAALAKRIDQSDEVAPIVHAFSQQIAPEAIRLVGICAIMLTQNVKMTLVCMSMLPLYLLIARRSTLKMRTNLEPYYELWEGISTRITDAIGSIKTVKLSGAEARERDYLEGESRAAYDVYLLRIRNAQRFYITQSILSHLSRSMVLGYGGWLVLNRELTPGDVVMFMSYLDRLYSPIDSLNGLAVNLQNNLVSLQRAMGLLAAGPIEAEGGVLPPGPGKVEFRNVRFSYVPGREVLKGVNITLQPGKITGIVGPSGAGKTTAADLLLKLFEPDSGDICIDGARISECGPSAVRAAIGVVAADGAVFRGTLADNIRYKRPNASREEVLEAALAAGLGRCLERLPDGLDTEIGERGIGLSVGERQRLQIARTLVDKPRLLVLDEATANLDYATENEVRHALSKLSPRPTMLIIAHRYTMVRDADYVVVMRDGQVIEEGPPNELIASGGWFSELARQSGQADAGAGLEPE